MKMRMFLMIFVVAVLAVAVQAAIFTATSQLDSMDNCMVANGGRWFDARGYVPSMVKQNTDLAYVHEGTGSMMIDYSQFTGGEWDVDARGDYGRILPANLGPISVGINDAFTFWAYRPASGAGGAEHIRELQVYSPGGDNRAVATVVAQTDAPNIAVGWTKYTIERSDFTTTNGVIDWDNIDLVNFFVSCWADNGIGWWEPGGPGTGNWEPMPGYIQYPATLAPIYIDDFQLIPEPATISLLALGTLAMLKRRKA